MYLVRLDSACVLSLLQCESSYDEGCVYCISIAYLLLSILSSEVFVISLATTVSLMGFLDPMLIA